MKNFKFTPAQLDAIQDRLDTSTPSAFLRTWCELDNQLKNLSSGEDTDLPKVLAKVVDADGWSRWNHNSATYLHYTDLTSERMEALDAYLKQDADEFKHDYELDMATNLFGTPRGWLNTHLMLTKGNGWDDEMERLTDTVAKLDVMYKDLNGLCQDLLNVMELSTKANRERIEYGKDKVMQCSAFVNERSRELLKGGELTQDDQRKLDSHLSRMSGGIGTHGLTYDKKAALKALVNNPCLRVALACQERLKSIDIKQRTEDVILEQLQQSLDQMDDMNSFRFTNGVLEKGVDELEGRLRHIVNTFMHNWNRDSIADDIEDTKQAVEDVTALCELFGCRITDVEQEELDKVDTDAMLSTLDALAGELQNANQETAKA